MGRFGAFMRRFGALLGASRAFIGRFGALLRHLGSIWDGFSVDLGKILA